MHGNVCREENFRTSSPDTGSARPDGQHSGFDSLLPTHMESPGERGEP